MLDHFIYSENSPLLFTQAKFWVFFGAIVLLYQLVYKKVYYRNLILLLFSLYFYYLSSGFYFTLLLFSTLVDYYLGDAIYKTQDIKKKKRYVTLSVVINLGVLSYFKYTYFFTDTFNQIFQTNLQANNLLAQLANGLFGTHLEVAHIFLPVGISFFTFQTISYSIDIYRGHVKPVKSIIDFAFYVSFFPQLVAGPIVRAADFVPQIYKKYHLSQEEFSRAFFLIVNGLVKKILISDYISVNFVDRVFESPTSYSGFENLMAVYGYAIQIYCDFSGYTDIAIGVALLLGFRLPLNFNSPYQSTSITDFWRRWHISLSSWLRDYLYIPLGGNRKGNSRTYVNLLITMLLGGLWHGAHMRFVIWGGLHGLALAFHKLWSSFFKNKVKENFATKLVAGFITFHFVCFCWIFFRANSMDAVYQMLLQISTNFHYELINEVLKAYSNIFIVMLIGYALHWTPSSVKLNVSNAFARTPDYVKAFMLICIAIFLFQMKSSEIQPFIYFQF
ncbi:MBOAT family protein [Rapidithrix thailandica]|uniref:MBOAT family protein n=1 Tax=Rapidithrix thailandica TaxID=413964 RepID=A0AAW9SDD3_9BACT